MLQNQIRAWYNADPSRIPDHLRGTDWTVDHILAHAWGGAKWPHNYFLMPQSDNSHFSDWANQEKKRYVGNDAWKMAQALQQWVNATITGLSNQGAVDFSRFDPVTQMGQGR